MIVPSTKIICDFCNNDKPDQAELKCFICKKDICYGHSVSAEFKPNSYDPTDAYHKHAHREDTIYETYCPKCWQKIRVDMLGFS